MAAILQPELTSENSQLPTSNRILVGDSLATGIAFALILTIGQRAIGFLRSIVFCRLMTDQELGQWSIVWGFILLLPPLAMLGLPGCFGKYTEYYLQRGNVRAFIFQVALVSGLTTCAGLLALFFFPSYFAGLLFGDSDAVGLVFCLTVTLVAVSISNFAGSLLESVRQVRLVSVMRLIIVVCFTLIGSLSIVLFERTVEAVTLAYGFSCFISLLPAIWLIFRCREQIIKPSGSIIATTKMWKRILPFAGWLWLSNLLNNSLEIVDRYMLLTYSNVSLEVAQSYVGQYHSSRIIPTLLSSIAIVLGGILLPYLSRLWEAGQTLQAAKQQNLTLKLLSIAFVSGGIVILTFSEFFFETILQGRYNDGMGVFPLTMVCYTWLSLYTVGQDYLWVAERGKLVSLSLTAGLLVSILLNYWLIPIWGLWGAVIAASCGMGLLLSILVAMNHFSGCRADRGVWFSGLLPLLLLIQPSLAALSILLIMLLAIRTDWFFNQSEKDLSREYFGGLFQRFRT